MTISETVQEFDLVEAEIQQLRRRILNGTPPTQEEAANFLARAKLSFEGMEKLIPHGPWMSPHLEAAQKECEALREELGFQTVP